MKGIAQSAISVNAAPDKPGRGNSHVASLEELLNPASIALIGASDRVLYSALASHNLDLIGYPGKVFAVNRRGVEAHGRPGVSSCSQIGEQIDLGYVMVPQKAVWYLLLPISLEFL